MTAGEPMEGEELLSLVLGPYQMSFDFAETLLALGAHFGLRLTDGSTVSFDPANRAGDVSRLWPLLGQVVSSVDWPDESGAISIAFASGERIEIPAGYPRGTIYSKVHANQIEDF